MAYASAPHPTPVYSGYFKGIDDARFYFYGMGCGADAYAIVKSSTTDTCIYNVFTWLGSRLQRVFHWVDSVMDKLSFKEKVGQLFIYTIAPVSYTHLDVYKRQLLM